MESSGVEESSEGVEESSVEGVEESVNSRNGVSFASNKKD